MNNTSRLVAILVIIAVAIGILFVFWTVPMSSTDTPPQDSGTATAPAPSGSSLSAEAKQLLTPPASSASEAEKQAYMDLIWSSAKETTSLSVGAGCSISPVVAQIEPGATLTFKNTDDKAHTLQLDPSHSLAVPAGESKTIAVDFLKTNSLQHYSCDDGDAAMLLISEAP